MTSKLRVLVVDDEALARTRLTMLLAECGIAGDEQVAQAAQAQAALALLAQRTFDLVLLDIHMPGMDGLRLAEALGASNGEPGTSRPAIVFVTAHAGHALEAFDLAAVDYLTKPVRRERLQAALAKASLYVQALQAPAPAPEHLLLQDRGRSLRLALSEVLYFKAELKYLTVRTATHSHIHEAALSDLAQRHGERFVRIHRNALVARNAMRALERHDDPVEGESWSLSLVGVDERLAVSRRQLAAVRAALAQ